MQGAKHLAVTAVVPVTAVVQVQSLAQEIPHASGAAKKKKKSHRSFNVHVFIINDNVFLYVPP